MDSPISFHQQESEFQLKDEAHTASWIARVVAEKGAEIAELNYIFCSDEYLLALNREYLEHDYFTDILTFPYDNPEGDGLWSDIYISIDRVQDNAQSFASDFETELYRVMIHGVLHLLGYDDHGEKEAEMRRQEEWALSLR